MSNRAFLCLVMKELELFILVSHKILFGILYRNGVLFSA